MNGEIVQVDALDLLATWNKNENMLAVAAVNKDPVKLAVITIRTASLMGSSKCFSQFRIITVNGPACTSFNDVDHEDVRLSEGSWLSMDKGSAAVTLEPHSVNVIQIR